VNITGNANGSDTANLYDNTGTNHLVAQGSTATLTTSVNTVAVTQFGKVNAFKTNGTTDTVHQQSVDFALQTVGSWTSV
jgi:septal ring-binding cell division protein DamX